MRIDVLTLFPEVVWPYLSAGILGRASAAGIVEFHVHQLRDFTNDPHRKVDDRPFGGGPGMVLMCQPVCDAVDRIESLDARPSLRLMTSPQGRLFTQSVARRLAGLPRLLLICGRYEGFDERITEILHPEEYSLGDFVLTGGELPALAVIDAVVRLLDGALGNDESAGRESFERPLLDHPNYTRPREFRGHVVPEVLLSGDHARIEAWRQQQSHQRTRERRPDLSGPLDRHTPAPRGVRPDSWQHATLPRLSAHAERVC